MKLSEWIIGKKELKELKWWDIAVVSVIMFGQAVYLSTVQWFTLTNPGIAQSVEFTAGDNIQALSTQVVLLALAFLYLRFRNFDFTQWKCRITPLQILYGVLLFILAALVADAVYYGSYYLFPSAFDTGAQAAQTMDAAAQSAVVSTPLDRLDITTIVFSALNGFYEEIFFLGMCLFVARKNVKYFFIYSLLLRFSFHTYQGWISAIGITTLGVIYFFIYEKTKRRNLFPFFFSHAIADVLGLGILGYFLR